MHPSVLPGLVPSAPPVLLLLRACAPLPLPSSNQLLALQSLSRLLGNRLLLSLLEELLLLLLLHMGMATNCPAARYQAASGWSKVL